MLQRTLLVSVISALLCAPCFADEDHAAEKNQPLNDFFQTELVFNQEQGEWQVKLGADVGKDDEAKTTEISTGLEYGLTDSLQVEIDHTPYIRVKPKANDAESVNGGGNTSLGLKKNWMNIGGSPNSVALGYEHEFANGDADIIGEDTADSDEVYVTLARDLSKTGRTQTTLQIGNERSDGEDEAFANLAAFHAMGSHVLTGEYHWSEEESWVTPGIFWKPHKNLELGAGVGIGVNDTDGHRVMTRLNYEWD